LFEGPNDRIDEERTLSKGVGDLALYIPYTVNVVGAIKVGRHPGIHLMVHQQGMMHGFLQQNAHHQVVVEKSFVRDIPNAFGVFTLLQVMLDPLLKLSP
jgi:hypothetical protein